MTVLQGAVQPPVICGKIFRMSDLTPSEKPPFTPPVTENGALEPFDDPALSHLPELKLSDLHFRPQRRTLLPIVLFLATCVSTFWVGSTKWQPLEPRYIASYEAMWQTVRHHWPTGMTYMMAVLAILLTHEMGHFLQTVKHRIPASYPLCIPVPFNAIGTMGAVIGMDGMRANRRQIFDIGIAVASTNLPFIAFFVHKLT